MRTLNLILGLMAVLFVSLGSVYAQPFETIQIGDGTQKYSKPVWSPNGEKLAFWGPGGIYVCKWDGSEQPKKIFDTFGEDLMWASDSELVYWQKKFTEIKQEGRKPKRVEKEYVRIVTLAGQEKIIKEGNNFSALLRLHDGTICFYEGDAFYHGTPFIVKGNKFGETDPSKLRTVVHHAPAWDSRIKGRIFEDTDIWIESLDRSSKKRITLNKEYSCPWLSPDGNKILVNKPPHSNLVVLDTNGNEIVDLNVSVYEASPGLFAGVPSSTARWSPDGKKIVYMLEIDNSAKGTIESLDLYVINADGSGRTQITTTANELETDPEWSPDGTKIACWSENMGKIFVIKQK